MPITVELPPDPGTSQSLLQSIYLSGLAEPPPLCTGMGRCGRCRVRFPGDASPVLPQDKAILSQELLEQGWRLSCCRPPLPGTKLELPKGTRLPDNISPNPAHPVHYPPTMDLAVDFGSSSLHFAAVDPALPQENDPQMAEGILINPQMGAGGDVLSRVAFALEPEGLQRLSRLSRAALARMLEQTQNRHKRGVREICLAGNSAMTHLFLGLIPSGLAAAPYHLDYRGGDYAHLPDLPPVWVAPLSGPFIGGDLSAGYAALAFGKKAAYPFMLADLGTNGEFILALSPEETLAASLPLGPALEGAGMCCGAAAGPGVVTGFTLSPQGPEPILFTSAYWGGPALGISGSGYLSLIRCLLQADLLRADGGFSTKPPTPLGKRLAKRLRLTPQEKIWEIGPQGTLYLAASDVEEMLKIRASFTMTMHSLLEAASLGFADLQALYLAGSLGSHTSAADLEALAFIPPGGSAKIRTAGNTSLSGATLLCRQPELRQKLIRWASRVQILNLPEQPNFLRRFAAEMHF
ncbi:MAG: ASKHA domain-containing protein [Desulfovibrionaceae bacterium]|nr:ASKHA domain-containing protein [Desulfovibrionaceae bacterium]